MTNLTGLLLVLVAIALVESAVNKFGYDWQMLPESKYTEVSQMLKTALSKDPKGKRLTPNTVLFGTEAVKQPELASLILGKLYSLVVIDKKGLIHVVMLSELAGVGEKVIYGPLKFTPESPTDHQEMKTVQSLVTAGKIDEARKKTHEWYVKTKRNGLFGGTSLNIQ